MAEADRAAFLHFTDPESIRDGLAKEHCLAHRYLTRRNDEERYEQLCFSAGEHEVGMAFRDVDPEKRDELARQNTLNAALSEAEKAGKSDLAFLSRMSHDIRTPMNAIIGLGTLALNDDTLSEKSRDYLMKIGDNAQHLLGLINEILDMSRIKSGQVALHREEFHFKGMLEQLNSAYTAKCRNKGISYNTTSFIENKIIKYCRREHIRVYADVTEWYEVRTPKSKKDLFPYVNALSVDRRIRKLDQKLDGVIAISRYLYDYYSQLGVSVIRIPPIFHYERHYLDTDGECKTILYAGSPSVGKDETGILIDAVKAVNSESVVLKLVFVGVNRPEDADALEKYGISFRPRCNTDQVIEYVRSSDFTVLFRREKRFAKAGYSTKVAESLFNGDPVLCNEIGGTDTDIENMKNGIKIKGLSMDDVYAGL